MNQRQEPGLPSYGEPETNLGEALKGEDCKLSNDEEQLLTHVRQCMDFRKYSEDKQSTQDLVRLSSSRIKNEETLHLKTVLPVKAESFASPQLDKD